MENNKGWRRLVEKNTINLLEAITKQKNNDLIIFTTYVFDPIFFDGYILRKLKQNNPNATIIILMDGKNYSKLQDDFTRETGIEYALIPIAANLFHSKIFLFISKSKLHVFVGSHNLTLSGVSQNLEISFESDNNLLVNDCLEYVNYLLEKNLDSKNPWYKKIEPYLHRNDQSSSLLTNENEPILDQCLRIVSKKLNLIRQVVIFSPYFSKTNQLIEKILSCNPTEIKLCIQKNNHNLDTSNLNSFELLSLNELKTKQESRRLHSKFIAFRGSEKDLILVGSPNFTSPALLKTSNDGNFESALLLEQNYDLFSNNFKLNSITNTEIENSKRVILEQSDSGVIPEVLLNFAYFDDLNRLNIECKSKTKKLITAEFYSDEDKITKSFELDEGKNSVSLSSISREINEICFTENNKPISNRIRICSPKGMKIRIGFELEDSRSVQKSLVEIVDFDDIANFCLALFSPDTDKIGDSSSSDVSEITPSPGKRSKTKTSSGLFDLLNQLFRLSVTRTPQGGSDKSHVTKTTQAHQKEIDELISDLIDRMIIKFEREVIPKSNFAKRYSVYLVIALKLLKKLEDAKTHGISSVHVISGLDRMIARDPSFSDLDWQEKIEVLFLLIEVAKEVELGLHNPHKFDEESILSELKLVFSNYLKKDDPIEKISNELKNCEKYGLILEIGDAERNIIKEIFQQVLLRLSIHERLDYPKKLIHVLDNEIDPSKITSAYDTLKIFLEKDVELRDKINQETQFLENKQNVDAIKRIINKI